MNNTFKKTLLISAVCVLSQAALYPMDKVLDIGAGLVGGASEMMPDVDMTWIKEKVQVGAEYVGKAAMGTVTAGINVYTKWADERQRQIVAEFKRKIAVEEAVLNAWGSTPEQKERALREIDRLTNEKNKQLDELNKMAMDAANRGKDLVFDIGEMGIEEIKASGAARREQAKAVAVEEQRGKDMLARVDKLLNFVSEKPYVIIGIAAGLFGSYFALKHGIQHVSDAYKIPTLAQETSLVPYRTKFKNWLLDEQLESDLTEVKLTDELTELMAESALGLKRMAANDSILQNKLFYGPPGTGKTEFARRLARYSGMHYIYFSSSALEKFSIEEATRQIEELFTFAEHSSTPLLIIADEAELVFADKSKLFSQGSSSTLDAKRLAINNQFLTYLSKGSKHYMVIAITNYPDQLDAAFINRCDETIFFDAPDAYIRRQIFDLYVDKYLIKGKHLSSEKKGLFNRLLATLSFAQPPKRVAIEEDTFSEEAREEIASHFDKWVGRDIEQFVTALETAARATDSCTINPAVVRKVLERKKAERAQLEKGSYFMKPAES